MFLEAGEASINRRRSDRPYGKHYQTPSLLARARARRTPGREGRSRREREREEAAGCTRADAGRGGGKDGLQAAGGIRISGDGRREPTPAPAGSSPGHLYDGSVSPIPAQRCAARAPSHPPSRAERPPRHRPLSALARAHAHARTPSRPAPPPPSRARPLRRSGSRRPPGCRRDRPRSPHPHRASPRTGTASTARGGCAP